MSCRPLHLDSTILLQSYLFLYIEVLYTFYLGETFLFFLEKDLKISLAIQTYDKTQQKDFPFKYFKAVGKLTRSEKEPFNEAWSITACCTQLEDQRGLWTML